MGNDPSTIREEIEETRLRVGEEVEALSYKTDVGARLDDYVDEKKEAIAKPLERAGEAIGSVMPGSGGVSGRRQAIGRAARRNPLGLVIGGASVGFFAGLLLPSTRVEDQQLGGMATQVKEIVRDAGQEAIDRGKEVAETAFEAAKEEGSTQGRELAADLTERLQDDVQRGPTSTS
ncbi:MAG: DUF3618 domain-containing protein [Gaiella sp.]